MAKVCVALSAVATIIFFSLTCSPSLMSVSLKISDISKLMSLSKQFMPGMSNNIRGSQVSNNYGNNQLNSMSANIPKSEASVSFGIWYFKYSIASMGVTMKEDTRTYHSVADDVQEALQLVGAMNTGQKSAIDFGKMGDAVADLVRNCFIQQQFESTIGIVLSFAAVIAGWMFVTRKEDAGLYAVVAAILNLSAGLLFFSTFFMFNHGLKMIGDIGTIYKMMGISISASAPSIIALAFGYLACVMSLSVAAGYLCKIFRSPEGVSKMNLSRLN